MKCKTTSTNCKSVTSLPEAIFFDLDGTLVDSAPDIRACLFEAFLEQGINTDGLSERFRIGPPLDIMIRSCLLYTSPSPRDGLLSRMPSSA